MNMTNEQAKFINERAFLVDAFGDTDEYLIEAKKLAISALEKQIPKRPINVVYDEDEEVEYWNCPKCELQFSALEDGKHDFCIICGQAIDWEEVE